MSFQYLSFTIGAPLVGVAAIALLPKRYTHLARPVALIFSLITLGFAIADTVAFKTGGPRFQLTEDYDYALRGETTAGGRRAYHVAFTPKVATGKSPSIAAASGSTWRPSPCCGATRSR